MIGVRIEFSEDPRDFKRRDWSELVEADPSGTFFHTPSYLKLYWEEFGGSTGSPLLAFAVDEAGAQVGAVAFERIDETLRFLGGTEVTDYMGPVGREGTHDAVAAELLAALAKRDDWERADLRGLPEDSSWLRALSDAAVAQGLSARETEDQNGVAPSIDLPETWGAYLERLPSKLRHEIKRKARRLESGGGSYRLVRATEQTFAADVDRFVELHRSSEGPKGVFMQPGMELFFRRLAEEFLPAGVFRLNFLEIDGTKIAGTIGFEFHGRSYLYNSAFDHAWRQLSPGMVLVAEDIREAIEDGCGVFDLLKGDYPYKYRFGAAPRRVRRLVAAR